MIQPYEARLERDSKGVWLLLAVVVPLAVVGAYLAAGLIARGAPAAEIPTTANGSYFVGGPAVPTSFGAVSVEYVQKLTGLTTKDVAGATHGVGNFVSVDKAQIQVSVSFSNETDHPVVYSPEQFVLIGGREGKAIPATSATIAQGTVRPKARLEGTISFVSPRDNSQLWLEFRAPGEKPLRWDLGSTDKPTPQEIHSDYHHHTVK